jgi:Glyoxalase/Bleomycin resistance protein/Dioxygenase superfamily
MTGLVNPNMISRQVDQVAFVVDSLENALPKFKKLYGIDHWNLWLDLAKGQSGKRYYDAPGDFEFSCAYGYVGDVQIELCQHDSGRSVYKDWLDTKGPGLNHWGFRMETQEAYNAAAANFIKLGAPFAMGGDLPGIGGWAYFDTVELIGCYSEIYWSVPRVTALFERMKRGETVSLR